jgi:hypothetical protein
MADAFSSVVCATETRLLKTKFQFELFLPLYNTATAFSQCISPYAECGYQLVNNHPAWSLARH